MRLSEQRGPTPGSEGRHLSLVPRRDLATALGAAVPLLVNTVLHPLPLVPAGSPTSVPSTENTPRNQIRDSGRVITSRGQGSQRGGEGPRRTPVAEVCGQALRAWQAPPRSWGVLEAAQSWCCGFGLTLSVFVC